MTYATGTELAKSTALHDSAIILEAGSCKPSVTNDKPTVMRSQSIARSQCWATVSKRTRSGALIDPVHFYTEKTRVRKRPWDRIRGRERVRKRAKKREKAKEKESEKESARKREWARPTYMLTPHDSHPIADTRGHVGRESEVIQGSRHLAFSNEWAVMCRLQSRLMPDSVHWWGVVAGEGWWLLRGDWQCHPYL